MVEPAEGETAFDRPEPGEARGVHVGERVALRPVLHRADGSCGQHLLELPLGALAKGVEAVVEAGDVRLLFCQFGLTRCRLTVNVVNGTLRAILLVVATNADISTPAVAVSSLFLLSWSRLGFTS
ncbi:hypothetical protein [Nonomuraea salmonea]|uniref:hypothetical protein n=1 Tax=Nonomuraea salmonea TaxID=46181 RepID=UPI0031E4E787